MTDQIITPPFPNRAAFGSPAALYGATPTGSVRRILKSFAGRRLGAGYPQINARAPLYCPNNPAASSTITLNGTVVTFVASGATGNQVNIGGTNFLTLQNLAVLINASADAQLAKFYAAAARSGIILYARIPGAAGNGLTIATTISGATLDSAVTIGGYTGELPTVTLSQTSTSSIPNARTVAASATDAVRAIGSNIVLKGGGFVSPPTYAPTNSADTWEVFFDWFGSVFELRTWSQNSGLMAFVDDVPIQDHQTIQTGNASQSLLKIDFAGVRRWRRIRIVGINFYYSGLYVGPLDTVYQPKEPIQAITVVGTSYEAGTGSGQGLTPMSHLARKLGLKLYGNGIGSSGWNTSAPNDPATRITTYLANLANPAVFGASPEIVALVWWLGINDMGGNMTTALAALKAGVDAANLSLPNIPQVFVGCDTANGPNTNSDLVNAMLTSGAAYANAPLIANTVITAVNSGELTSQDGIHPVSVLGAAVRGEAIAEAMLTVFG
jgi:hypothetical protein